MSDVSANKTLVKFPRWKVKDGFRSEYFLIVKLREREGKRVDLGRSLKGHL